MQLKLLTTCIAAALALAACGKDDRQKTGPASSGSTAAPAQEQSTTTTTPANVGQAQTAEEKREGANPTQGQVDPKESVQRKDFEQRGDAAGPQSAETAPRN